MSTLDVLQVQLLRMHQQGNWWQLALLYVVLLVLWYSLRRCRHNADVKLPVQVAELWVYPVKSCAGIQLPKVLVDRGGLEWDRQFAIVKPDGEVLSQKTHPELAKICPSFSFAREGCILPWGEPLPVRKGQNDNWERVHDLPPGTNPTAITLSVGESSVQVRLTPDASTKKVSTVWGGNSTPLCAERYADADTWLREQLGIECSICRLVSTRQLRTTRLAPVSNDENDCCRYQDGAPLTILSQESVAGGITEHHERLHLALGNCPLGVWKTSVLTCVLWIVTLVRAKSESATREPESPGLSFPAEYHRIRLPAV